MAKASLPAGWSLDERAPPAEQVAQAAQAPVALPPGFTAEASAPAQGAPVDGPDNFWGVKPGTAPDEITKGLRTLTEHGADPDTIRRYVAASNSTLPPETEKWLNEEYAKNPQPTDWQHQERPTDSAADAAWRGLQSGALMGWDDELQAGSGALGNKLGTLFGLNASTASLPEIYDAILKERRQSKDAAYEDHPLAYGMGFAPGALLSAFATRGRGALPENPTLWQRIAPAMVEGAKQGAISGAGNADSGFWNTMAGAGMGAALGGPLGALSVPVSDLVGNLAGRVWNRVRPSAGTEATSGLDVLDARAPQNAATMRQNVQDMQAAGVPPRLVDVVDASGRRAIRDATHKINPANQAVEEHAAQVYSGAQDRVVDQARRNITDNPMTGREVARQIQGDPTLDIIGDRDSAMGQAMAPLRNQPVPITPEIQDILATREGQAALRGAEGLMTDPADRATARQVLAAAREHAKGPQDVDAILRKEVPGWDELPQPVKDAYLQQRPDLAEPPDPFKGVTLTLDTADKFARAMKGRAAKTPGLERVTRDFANTVRNSARQAIPEYDAALNHYAAQSGVADAAGGTGAYQGSSFLNAPADDYAARVGAADTTPAAIPGGAEGAPTMSERQAMALRARDEIVDQATSGGGQNAGRVARQIAYGGGDTGAGQAARSEALLGQEGAQKLQQGMQQEVNRVRNTEFIDPARGSKTAVTGRDAIVDGFSDAVSALSSKWHIIHAAGRWLKAGGIRGIDAERLSRDAISSDPARIDQAIDYLEQKGMQRARAAKFVSTLAGAIGGRAAGATQTDNESAPAPNSIRALNRNRVGE